jgi:hypothetical protein
LNSIDKLRPDAFSAIALVDGREFRLHFAGELATSALLPHLQNEDIAEYKALLTESSNRRTSTPLDVFRRWLWNTSGRDLDGENWRLPAKPEQME